MAKRGPKRKPFDWNLLEALAGKEASCRYVAEYMLRAKGKRPEDYGERWPIMIESMCRRIVRNVEAVYGTNYVEFMKKKREGKKLKLIESLFERAIDPNGPPAIAIFLAKNLCGMTDKVESVNTNTNESKLVVQFTNEDEEKEDAVTEGL